MTKKPLIGIITILDAQAVPRVSVNINYQNADYRAGGVPILLPVTREEELLAGYADMCDGFLFSGGQDISPCRYNELPSRLTRPQQPALRRLPAEPDEAGARFKKTFYRHLPRHSGAERGLRRHSLPGFDRIFSYRFPSICRKRIGAM